MKNTEETPLSVAKRLRVLVDTHKELDSLDTNSMLTMASKLESIEWQFQMAIELINRVAGDRFTATPLRSNMQEKE